MKRGLPIPFSRWRGLTLQLFLFTVLPLTVLLLLIVFGSLALHQQAMRELVGDRDLRAVRASAASLSQAIQDRADMLRLLAVQPGVQAARPSALDTLAADYGFESGLARFDANGTLLAASAGAAPALLQSPSLPAGQDFQFFDPIQTADGRWLVRGVVRMDTGYLVGGFQPAALAQQALEGITSGQATMLLLSSQGQALYQYGHLQLTGSLQTQPGVADVLRGESGVNYASTAASPANGHSGELVIAFAPVPPFQWGLVLQEPWEQNANPMLRASQSAPLILAPVLVLALLALWFGARQVVEPLQSLEERAGRVGSGDFQAIHESVGGITEIRNLQDEMVEMANALRSAQDALHSYIGSLTAGIESERRALARELHDDTLQALIALNQHVQLALLRTSDPSQRQQLQELQTRITQTIANLRRAIGGLRPIYLEDLGLAAALSMLARQAEQPGSPQVRFEQRGEEVRLPEDTELAFYRIAQEALNNAIHHGHPRHVNVQLYYEAGEACLTVTDDGKGFQAPEDPGAFAHLGHFGLLGMRERAELAGVDLRITSTPGQGTRVEVRTPLPDPAEEPAAGEPGASLSAPESSRRA